MNKNNYSTLFKVTIILSVLMMLPLSVRAQSIATERAEKIKSSTELYYWGEGTGITEADADMQALAALSNNIKVTINRVSTQEDIDKNDNFSSSISIKTGISSFTTLTNTEQIIISREPNARVLRYLRRAELEEIFKDREAKITDLTEQGRNLEKNVDIAGALKYYNWALALSTIHPRNIYAEINGKNENLKIWLNAKINTIFANIKVDVDNVEEQLDDFDKYLVNLKFSYLNQPVSGLDFSYYNGLKKVDNCHAKNGIGVAEFPELPNKEIEISYEYKYEDVARNFDEELKSYYEYNDPIQFARANAKIPVKVKGKALKVEQKKYDTAESIGNNDANLSIAPPEVAQERKRVTVNILENNTEYVSKMQNVESAIRSSEYETVKSCFTDEGYKLFLIMMNSGRFTVLKNPEYYVEQTESFTVGRSIPVRIKYKGKHTCTENIIFRFDGNGLIESMAYALTKRAEDDIFRQSRWKMSARYSIMHFMEDYQTAFSLKRLDFIKKIFSNDAIIIQGKVLSNGMKRNSGFVNGETIYRNNTPKVMYTKRTKDEYMQYLERDFSMKQFIKLSLEDNEIVQANTNNLTGDVYWIEIKQFYSSNTYCDQGYLTLMLDMSDISPVIKIRTWLPNKVDLDDMMKRFNIE